MIAVSVFSPVFAATDEGPAEPAKNPHADAQLCDSCHAPDTTGKGDLLYDGDVLKLCRSCHDGRLAGREGHPSGSRPKAALKQAMSSGFPLQDGMMTCLTCHDAASQCTIENSGDTGNPFFLRGSGERVGSDFCFGCHESQDYEPFNAHDQIDAGQMREDVCQWCHVGVPDVNAAAADASSELHSELHGVCENCHSMASPHPTDRQHMGIVPPAEMRSYMAAYEMKHRMNMPFSKLLEYVVASGRKSHQLPLDKDDRIVCYSCHNPHEKGLLPVANPRSVGADSDKAANQRLRASEDAVCRACHYK